jgi:hypothetical protein
MINQGFLDGSSTLRNSTNPDYHMYGSRASTDYVSDYCAGVCVPSTRPHPSSTTKLLSLQRAEKKPSRPALGDSNGDTRQ